MNHPGGGLRPQRIASRISLILITLALGATLAHSQDAQPQRYNSTAHQIVTDMSEESRLQSSTPQWVNQLLHWPSNGEIESHLAIKVDELAAEATDNLGQVLRDDYIPFDITDWWVPLRDWNIFYTDWIDLGGADAFLINYTVDQFKIQIADTPNFVIVGVRPPNSRPSDLLPEPWVVRVVEAICQDAVLPISTDDSLLFRTLIVYEPNEIVEGDWTPRAIEGRRSESPDNETLDIERVKFFTDGQIVIISVPKYLADPTNLVNPFADRFPIPDGPAEVRALAQTLFRPDSPTPTPTAINTDQMEVVLANLLRATPSEFLAQDWARRMQQVGVDMDPEELEHLVQGGGTERIGLWHAQQLSERLMAEGVQHLAAGRFEDAAQRFEQILILDPFHVSSAVMLEYTIGEARDWARSTDQRLPLRWFAAANQALDHHRSSIAERRIMMQERSEEGLALTNLRSQWLEAYRERDFRQARLLLERMRAIDPNDTTTVFFIELIEGLIQAEERSMVEQQ